MFGINPADIAKGLADTDATMKAILEELRVCSFLLAKIVTEKESYGTNVGDVLTSARTYAQKKT